MIDNQQITQIEKAEVTIPAPGAKIYGIRRNPSRGVDMPSATKRQMADIFSEMYRQHPWIRTGIDKVAKVAAAPGIDFIPSDPEEDMVPLHKQNLKQFFRKSHAKKLLRMTYKDLLIFGEAFWWVDVTLGGAPKMAKRLHPKYMDAVVEDTELIEWRYGPFHQDGDAIFYDKDIILHFAVEDPDSDLIGLSPLISLQETVAQDLFAMRYNRSFFENAAQTGVIFNMRNATKDEVDRNRAWLEANYVGASNAHRPIILEGDIEVDKSVANAQEMEFLGLRRLNRQEIFGVLDLPPEKAGINEDSNRSTSKEADNSFREETIGPIQALVEEEVNDVLILELFGYDDILFQHEESDKRSKLAQMTIYTQAVDKGLLIRDEVRGELGRGKIPGGDVATISTSAGVVPLERLLEAPAPAPQVTPQDVEANGVPGVNPNAPSSEDTNARPRS
jgi:HK97 family phage portal protein